MIVHAPASASRPAAEPKPANTKGCPAWHARFLQMLPTILRHARIRLRKLPRRVREEAVDEAVANALIGYARLVELGKEDLAYPTPLAEYAVRQFHAGRQVGVSVNCHDITSRACRCRHGLAIERLDRFDHESGRWEEVVLEDKGYTPADAAATRLDFRAWLGSLDKRNRRLAETLAVGETTSTVARLFRISRGRVSQLRRELCAHWRLFQGEPAPRNQ